MAKFITIGYGNRAGYERTSPEARKAAHAHEVRMKAGGAVIGMAGAPVQVRNPEGGPLTTLDGAYLQSDLPIAGFAVIEAESLQEAVKLVSETPCAVAHGLVEIWPLQEAS